MSATRTTSVVLAVLAAVVLAWSMAGFAADAPKATNLVPNGEAEKGVAGKLPEGWSHYENTKDEVGITDKEFYTGKRCAFLKVLGFGNDARACTGLAVGKTNGFSAPNGIVVKGDTTYHYSFYIAGYGFKRKITASPWSFNEAGKERNRNIKGVSVLPSAEWTRYTGTFKTKAATRKVVLMFFVYGMEDRDLKEGATFYVDNVYLGEAEPPAAVKGSARIKLPAPPAPPPPPPAGATIGYKPMPKGANFVRVWDLGKKYTYKHYWPKKQWEDRANWIQVPYGKTADYKFRGDCMLEGPNFWMSLHASGHDACFLYNKTDAEGTPSRHNEMYRSYDQPGGLRTYCGSYEYNKIIKNERGDIIVESKTKTRTRKGVGVFLINRYRVQAGKPWLEIEPMNEMVSEQGMHGESRIHISPESLPGGQDFLADAWKNDPPKSIYHPHTSRMLLDLIMDDDCIWAMMWKTTGKIPSSHKHPYFEHRSRSDNCRGGYPAGWQRIGEGKSPLILTSPFVKYRKEKMVLGVLRIGHWHYQKIGAAVQADKDYKGQFKYAYLRKVKSSPFSTGKRWWPMYPGKWRMIGCVDGKYHTQKITVTKDDVGKSEFTFRSPLAGTLEYVVFYLYDRTDQTPKDVFTIMDIYRQSTGDNKAKETGK